MKKLLLLGLFLIFPTFVFADDITNTSNIFLDDEKINSKITDDKENTYITINKDNIIKIQNTESIYGLYIIYELNSVQGTIQNSIKNNIIGENNFLHEYINVDEKIGNSNEITLTYNENVKIAEIYVLDNNKLPDFVEVWNNPLNEADLLLLSTHSDDEQLFFLGLLPTYVAKGAKVQVAYFVNHNDNPKRLHEQLHGLYTVGIRNYPIIGEIPDAQNHLMAQLKTLKRQILQ